MPSVHQIATSSVITAGVNTLIPNVIGKTIKVCWIHIGALAILATTISLRDGTNTPVFDIPILAGASYWGFIPLAPFPLSLESNSFRINRLAALASCVITCDYYYE